MGWALLVAFGLLAAMLLTTWREQTKAIYDAVFGNSGFALTPTQAVTLICASIAVVAILTLVSFTFETVKQDFQTFTEKKKAESAPPVVADPGRELTVRQAVIAAYQARDFVFHSRLSEEVEWPQVWVSPRNAQDDTGRYRTAAALIYEDGTATQFDLAVLHDEDVWQVGDETKVKRRQLGRAVSIKTTINEPAIRELISANDYVLSIGLASSTPSSAAERNEVLARARAFNIVYSVYALKLKSPDRLHAVSFGFATRAPANAAFEPRQRSVVIVGVNASRSVVVDDVVDSIPRLVRLEGLTLTDYSHFPRFVILGSVEGATDFSKVSDIGGPLAPRTEVLTLPAVPQVRP